MGEKRSRSSTKAWASLRPKHSSIKFPACCAAFTLDHGNPDWPMDIMMGLVVGDVPFHDLKNPTQGYLEPNLFVSLEIFLALLTIILVAKMFPTSIKPNFFPTGLYPSRRKKKTSDLKPGHDCQRQESMCRSLRIDPISSDLIKEKTHPSTHDFPNNIDNLILSAECHHLITHFV